MQGGRSLSGIFYVLKEKIIQNSIPGENIFQKYEEIKLFQISKKHGKFIISRPTLHDIKGELLGRRNMIGQRHLDIHKEKGIGSGTN